MFTHQTFDVTAGVGQTEHGSPISNAYRTAAQAAIAEQACEAFGGYSIRRGEGGWIDPDGKLVTEPTVVYTIHVQTDDVDQAVLFAQFVRRALIQHSVVLTRDGRSAFITGDTPA